MNDINFGDMMKMQTSLQDLYKGKWEPMEPETAKSQLLYMIEEVGEVISILKKKGVNAVVDDENIRANFCTEMADVLMYFTDVLLCMDVSPEEISTAFIKKYEYNMKRNYAKQNEKLYTEKPLEE